MCQHCDPYSPSSALAVMHNTGPARLDSDGCIVESGEYVAALYESYAADREWNRGTLARPASGIVDYGEQLASLSSYCRTAENLAEELWQRDLEEVEDQVVIRYPWQDPNCPHPEFHGDPQHVCP